MPEMDGLAATRLIRKRGGQLATVPIVALTANAFPEDIQECFDAGMNQFVPKPVSKEVLLNAILEALIDRPPRPRVSDPEDMPPPAPGAVAAPADGCADKPASEPACDDAALAVLAGDLGDDGMAEMLALFESETRARLGRLAAGAPDAATLPPRASTAGPESRSQE